MIRSYIKYFVCIAIMVGVTACGGDSSTGPDPSEAPELPDLQNSEAQMDISFFENTNPKALAAAASKSSTSNYEDGKSTALLYSGTFLNGAAYQGFLGSANQQDPNFNNGVWEWTYSYTYEGDSMEIRTTAEELNNEVRWAQYWSYSGNDGENFDDYKMFEGTASNDGSYGSWTFNALDPGAQEIPVVVSKYDITSDTQKELTAKFYDGSGNLAGTYSYIQDGTEHTLTISPVGESDIVVFWDTSRGAGYIKRGSKKLSWNSNQQNTP